MSERLDPMDRREGAECDACGEDAQTSARIDNRDVPLCIRCKAESFECFHCERMTLGPANRPFSSREYCDDCCNLLRIVIEGRERAARDDMARDFEQVRR